MKLFGEFLVDQSIISEERLLEIVIQQIADTPSVPEIIYQNKLMSNSDLLSVLKYQAIKKVDFKKAAQALGLWTDDCAQKLDLALVASRRPIGEILVQGGTISVQDLPRLLEEYMSLQSKNLTANPEEVPMQALTALQKDALSSFDGVSRLKLEIQKLENERSPDSVSNTRMKIIEILKECRGYFRLERNVANENRTVEMLKRLTSSSSVAASGSSTREGLAGLLRDFVQTVLHQGSAESDRRAA